MEEGEELVKERGKAAAEQPPVIKVDAMSMFDLLAENKRLREQVQELQERGSEMAKERQRWRDPERMKKFARTAVAHTMVIEEITDEFVLGVILRAMRELVEAP
jgi:hypothetical protein